MTELQQKGAQLLERLRGRGFRYHIENFVTGLAELTIRASKPEKPDEMVRITFQSTLYMSLPTHWENGDLHLATPEKHKQLMDSLGLEKEQQEQLLLFTTTSSSGFEIRILCYRVFVSQEIPL